MFNLLRNAKLTECALTNLFVELEAIILNVDLVFHGYVLYGLGLV